MEQKSSSRTDVIMAGLGGMGVLIAGQILSHAALKKCKYVTWLPSYGVQKRGGLVECTILFSDEKEIASPLIDQAQTVMVLDSSQFKAFEPRVRPGGVMLVESAGLEEEQERDDYELLKINAIEIATSTGDIRRNSLVLLGAYVAVNDAIPAELIEAELKERFGASETVLESNQKAFRRGVELGEALKQ